MFALLSYGDANAKAMQAAERFDRSESVVMSAFVHVCSALLCKNYGDALQVQMQCMMQNI
jgi:hypothetical protein